MRARIALIVIAVLAGLAVPPFVVGAGATGVAALDATFEGSFTVAGPDRSPIFTVTEAGRGSALGLPSGAFSYELWVVQDLRFRPSGCGPNSSTGHHGLATLSFADGHLRLRRVAGEACFAFPIVIGTEEWVASGGTGPYRTSTAGVRRTFRGDVRTGTLTGRWLAS
jgi:hypothetical protein